MSFVTKPEVIPYKGRERRYSKSSSRQNSMTDIFESLSPASPSPKDTIDIPAIWEHRVKELRRLLHEEILLSVDKYRWYWHRITPSTDSETENLTCPKCHGNIHLIKNPSTFRIQREFEWVWGWCLHTRFCPIHSVDDGDNEGDKKKKTLHNFQKTASGW